jgi:hypothetical protein
MPVLAEDSSRVLAHGGLELGSGLSFGVGFSGGGAGFGVFGCTIGPYFGGAI